MPQSDDAELRKIIELCRTWSPRGFITLYNWLQKAAGSDLRVPDHLYPVILALCDWRINRMMLIIGPGSGKSLLLSQIFPAAVLGHDPTQNVICVSGAENLAQGFQNVVMSLVEQNAAYKTVFPSIKPDKTRGWSATSGMFVTGNRTTSPDASYWAAGLNSKALTGKHGTLLIFDDLHDAENSATEDQCNNVVRKYVTQLTGRADPRGSRFMLAGRRWHERDLYGTLKDNGDWVALTLPAERKGSTDLWFDISVPEHIDCVFTDGKCMDLSGKLTQVIDDVESLQSRVKSVTVKENGVRLKNIQWVYGEDPKGEGFFWPDSKHKRMEYFSNKRLAPAETEAVYQCNPGARQGSVFFDTDFELRFLLPDNAQHGQLNPEMKKFLGEGAMVIQGWDTAFSATSKSDYSSCTTLLLKPCQEYHRGENPDELGPCDAHFDCYVVDVWKERATFASVVQKMREMYRRWQPYVMVVENKMYAVPAMEALENSGIPFDKVNPGPLESKRARAVEGVGAGSVQGWARQWRVRLPYEAPWLDDFLREMKDFTGHPGNTDDQADAFIHAVRWAIKNGGSSAAMPSGWNSAADIDASMLGIEQSGDPFEVAMRGYFSAASGQNPWESMCANCSYYGKVLKLKKPGVRLDTPDSQCTLHKRTTSEISTCDDFSDQEADAYNIFTRYL